MPKKQEKNKEYTAKDIQILEGLEPVRQRPGMYIGSTGPDGLHHLIWEVVDNCLDEAIAGYAKNIEIVLESDDMVSVSDDGRGIPVDVHAKTKKSALETVLTTLHAGAKFNSKIYQVSGGLHGVGVSVVCALAKHLKAEVCRGGNLYSQEFERGKAINKIKKEKTCKKTGTKIYFQPDREIFKGDSKFDIKKIINHLRQQAYLTNSVSIKIKDKRKEVSLEYSFYFEGGILSYLKYLIRGYETKNPNPFFVHQKKEDVEVEVAFQYTNEIDSYEESFVNNIFTKEGGYHLVGLRTALTRSINNYARKNGFFKDKDENLTGDDVREGLVSVVSIRMQDPQFEGQTKGRLGNQEIKPIVEQVVGEAILDYFEKYPQDAKLIIEKCILSSNARKAAKAARQTVLRKGLLEGLSLPGKLADCISRKPEESELFIVEGDSAGGCWSGNTKVALVDGRNLSFKDLVEEEKHGIKNYCYTTQENGEIGIAPILNPRITKKNTEVIKVILDTEEQLVCTPDHLFMLRNGVYKKAEDLTPQDSLMPFHKKYSEIGGRITIKGYEMIFQNKTKKWIFTHLLSSKYNIEKGIYKREDKEHIHHKDFNKLNNNPENLIPLSKEKHLQLHREILGKTLHRKDVKEKLIKLRQTSEFREKMKKAMTTPAMVELLSKRAKRQWQDEEYKKYMKEKFLEFYRTNKKYREENNKRLNEAQKEYWSKKENREQQSQRTKRYFITHPEQKEIYSQVAKKQWSDSMLIAWRSEMTKKQWTSEFREKRKKTYNQTYLNKALGVLNEIYQEKQKLDLRRYNEMRKERNDKTIIRYETICERFFNNDEKKLKEAVINFNHKIKKIIRLKQKIDVYDLEVEQTHNFALTSGIFVHNSAKSARDRRSQAILPLRGKILNIEKSRIDKVLASKEIRSLVIAMGTAIADDFNIEKLRYHKVIIMTDADVDGAHIRTLLLTLFFRYFREIIERGYLYIAQPPLYKIQKSRQSEYAYNEDEKIKILERLKGEAKIIKKVKASKGKEKINKEEDKEEEKIAGVSMQRYKGLGEMNPDQLRETTMDVEKRVLKRVLIEDGKEADKIFDILMGNEVMPRKKFIQTFAKKVKNLDI